MQRKQFSQQFSQIEVPPPLDQTTPEGFAAILCSAEEAKNVLVVDVRLPNEFEKGRIKGAVNTPLEECNYDTMAADIKKKRDANPKLQVYFTSTQSPDIDEVAALGFVNAFDAAFEEEIAKEKGSGGSGKESAANFVHILLGGVFYWFQLFQGSDQLTEAFCPEYWGPFLKKKTAAESEGEA